ncbi:MAG: UPF0182 family protein [Chloroflexi bacterium]|nr:UPF0182 family protein [Chloroflexota bacterium]
MSRDNFDIPEVFRRAMEEAGWNNGDDENGGGGRRPFPQQSGSRRPNRLSWLFAIVILLLLSLGWIVSNYTEWLWFTQLDYADVWVRQWLFRIISFAIFFVVGTLFLLGNWHLARRRAIRETQQSSPKILQIRGVRLILNGISLFLGFGFASSIAGNWDAFITYFYQVPFGTSDPIFNQDISFYLFSLPVYELLQQWLLSLLVLTTIGTLALYAINNVIEIQRGQWKPQNSKYLRQHVSLLATLILAIWAAGYIFSIFGLLYSTQGLINGGAGYTDLNASLYGLYAQLFFMALAAIAMLINVFKFSPRPLAVTAGLWLAATLLISGIFPGLVQQYSVVPNEFEREKPYIEYNIEYSRLAFGLKDVEIRSFGDVDELDEQTLSDNEGILRNVRLWDYRPLRQTYEKLQALRLYYQFSDVDIDRYEIDGELRQVMLAARELDKDNLEDKSWVNLNLVYTHGYGIVMNPVDQLTPNGQPEFFIQDLPPQSNVNLNVTRPEIYYGETTTDSVFVGTTQKEFDYPADQSVFSNYEGDGGVLVDSFIKELAFAMRFGDTNLLLSDEINSNSRVMFYRQIEDRVKQITPFLALDDDPYVVLVDGRLVWVQDAYTISDSFPYSEPVNNTNYILNKGAISSINYIRNSVKITIDAYDGAVTYYITDNTDPIIQTYAKAFPALFKSISELPEGLQTHLRYPEGLFRIQAEQYTTYHMTDAQTFFLKEDQWNIPSEVFESSTEQELEPYYVILNLPGEEALEYLLIQPMTPSGRDNMVAWIAARNDVPNYGELVVYLLPRQALVDGPINIEARIAQDTEISEQFSLWDQSGSSVIRGNLLTIPMGNSFLYVEPVYLQSTNNALPELKRVIVATTTRIAMRTTLDEALAVLIDETLPTVAETSTSTGIEEADVTPDESITPTAVPLESGNTETTADSNSVEGLIQSANAHFEAAETAQQKGDWATYGEELAALEADLARLAELIDSAP